jgi:rhamnosyltransferase
MKRLVIFQNYSYRDKAEDYVLYLLKSFREIADKIVVVSNSKLTLEDQKKYRCVSDGYYERENVGYDAGGYIDFFKKTSKAEMCYWDEIVLTNSSYFGPFHPWKNVFAKMENEECDFWGLTRHKGGGRLTISQEPIVPHIQSYFIVIKKKIIEDDRFCEFWNHMEYPESYEDAIIKFEMGFTRHFSEAGYKYLTYADQYPEGRNAMDQGRYLDFELIRDCGFPVVKYKHMDISNYKKASSILEYIRQNLEYDVGMIESYMDILGKKRVFRFDGEEILEFAKKYPNNLYLFGHGLCSGNLENFLADKGYHVKGYIVSEPVQEKELSVDDIDNFTEKGIIVALGVKAFAELKETIISRIPAEHCLLPNE